MWCIKVPNFLRGSRVAVPGVFAVVLWAQFEGECQHDQGSTARGTVCAGMNVLYVLGNWQQQKIITASTGTPEVFQWGGCSHQNAGEHVPMMTDSGVMMMVVSSTGSCEAHEAIRACDGMNASKRCVSLGAVGTQRVHSGGRTCCPEHRSVFWPLGWRAA